MISGGRPDSVGGGGSSRNFSGSAVSLADSVGGGGSSRNFRPSPITISQPHSVGGGEWEIFLGFLLTGGQDQSNYLNSGNFFLHFRVTSRLTEINCRKITFTKSLGGGPWPPWPPPGYATALREYFHGGSIIIG